MSKRHHLLSAALWAFAMLAVGAIAAPAQQAPAAPEFTAQRTIRVLYDNGNIATVYTNPDRVAVFDLARRSRITLVTTYHWNNARGARPGWIALIGEDGDLYGPWRATGSPGQGGVPNAYWTVRPDITVPSGRYMVIDSDPASWAQNEGSGGAGMVRVEGYPR